MANEVFKTPDVYLKETDNTFVRDTSNTVFGTGAITLKANQGPVNQRILFTRFRDFQQVFGKPTSTSDYGHFAARLYMSVAPSLYVVRASYGDESYATIQFPKEVPQQYEEQLSNGSPYLQITTTAETSDLINLVKIDDMNNIDQDFIDYKPNSKSTSGHLYISSGVIPQNGTYYDLSTNKYGEGVFCEAELNVQSGKYLQVRSYDGLTNVMLADTTDAPSATLIATLPPKSTTDYGTKLKNIEVLDSKGIDPKKVFYINDNGELEVESYAQYSQLSNYYISGNSASTTETNWTQFFENNDVSSTIYAPVDINIPKEKTLNGKEVNIDTYLKLTDLGLPYNYIDRGTSHMAIDGITSYKDLSSLQTISYYKNADDYASFDMSKVTNARLWESNTEIGQLYISGTPLNSANYKEVRSISFTEYGMGDTENWLVAAYAKVDDMTDPYTKNVLKTLIYESYGTNSIEAKDCTPYIAVRVDSNYKHEPLPLFVSANPFDKRCTDLAGINSATPDVGKILETSEINDLKFDSLLIKGEIIKGKEDANTLLSESNEHSELFIVYKDANDDKTYTTSVFAVNGIEVPTVPVNTVNTESMDEKYKIKEAVAIPTNQALVMYPDGYTKTCDTDEEPGIGDLEVIKPWNDSSLVIGALGPGKYANDIGIAIVTPDMYSIKALNTPNGFDWRWRFDDEDKNRNTPDGKIDYMISNPDKVKEEDRLMWTQVYKINVYRKPSDKTAEDAWGTGKEAIVSNIPVESYLVSNNPKLVDGEGKSLYAPNVINGDSNFIYISRKSVQSMGGKLPKKTFGIFPLVGGEDGTKSGINQKQAALQLYSDPNKANFDLIFNADAIESFASREKYRAAQIKFGEIAGSRSDALAIVQATSKEAKKLAKAQAEGKGFSFEYPSYVAMYAGYDKYFDPDLSSYVYLPKSVAAAVTEGWIMYNRNPWDAPAGVENGSIEYTTGSQLLNINADDLGELYSNNINCSRTMPIYGEVLWGNKTAQKKNTALRSINVRVLMNYVKKNVKQILTPYIFQINNETTRARMKNQLTNFINGIAQQGGCTGQRVRVWCSGEDLMNHIVRVEIGFIPPYTIQFIPVNIVLDSAANTIDIIEA